MSSVIVDTIKSNIISGKWNTALEKWGYYDVESFPSKKFCGFCHIRSFGSNGIPNIEYKIKIVNNKPVELPGVKRRDLRDLWSFISGIEIQKRQKNKEQSR